MDKEKLDSIKEITIEVKKTEAGHQIRFKNDLGYSINNETADFLIDCLKEYKKALTSNSVTKIKQSNKDPESN